MILFSLCTRYITGCITCSHHILEVVSSYDIVFAHSRHFTVHIFSSLLLDEDLSQM